MLSLNATPCEHSYLEPTGMALPGLGSFSAPISTTSCPDDPSKKVRKPYTITKSRESWTEPEHDKFLEALQLFDRDWKKIEAFIGSKTGIQIRSHAQKYFLKAQKSGTNERLPPPRPKRKAVHPYPHKAAKIPPVLSQLSESFLTLPVPPEPGFATIPDASSVQSNPDTGAALSAWNNSSVQRVGLSQTKTGQPLSNNCYSSIESTPITRLTGETNDQDHGPLRVLPDFAQVYSFIGSVFDPGVLDPLHDLKKMDRIDVEIVLLLMRNLSINLASPDFEEHRKLLSTYEIDSEEKYVPIGANKNPP